MTFVGGIFGLMFSSGEKLIIDDFKVVESKQIKYMGYKTYTGIGDPKESTIDDFKIGKLKVAVTDLYYNAYHSRLLSQYNRRIMLQDLGIDYIVRKLYIRQFLFIPRGNAVWFSLVVSFKFYCISFV